MEDRNKILLKEYEICQSHNNAIASQVWLSTSIFMSINLTLFGGLLFALLQSKILVWGITENPNSLFVLLLALLLAVAVVLTLCGWRSWLQRTQHITYVNNARMRQIEDAIKVNGESVMQKNWLVRGLDLTFGKDKCTEKIPEPIKTEINKKVCDDKELKKVQQAGFDSLSLIVCTATGLWLAAIVLTILYTGVSLILNALSAQTVYTAAGVIWVLAGIAIVILIVCFIKKCPKDTGECKVKKE